MVGEIIGQEKLGSAGNTSLLQSMKSFFDDNEVIDIGIGRDIGFDFARFGMKLPANTPAAVSEGFAEGLHNYEGAFEPSGSFDRKLIRLRLSAYKRNRVLDQMVSASFLEGISCKFCPITRIEMTSGTGEDTDATIDRVFNGGGYAIGNMAMMSQRANQAKGTLLPKEIVDIANTGEEFHGLTSIEWMRLACLTSLAAPPGWQQLQMPLFVFPPKGILLSNGFTLIQQCASGIAAGFIERRWESEMRNSVDGKLSKKHFSSFMEALIGQISYKCRGINDWEGRTFGICDSWESPLVYGRYKLLIESLKRDEVTKLISVSKRADQTLRQITKREFEGWSIETKGYTK